MDWVPFVLEDAREALIQWPQAQDRGMWVAGFFAGASNALPMGGEPEAFICGFSSGSIARANSESKRASTSEVRAAAARARWDREMSKQLEVKCAEYAVEDANACAKADANAMHKTGQDKTRQDTTEQEKTTTKRVRASFSPEMFDSMIPEAFAASSQFIEAWHSWVSDRHARRKAITEVGAKAQLAKLAREAVTPAAACQWIDFSIACGYQGIFPPKTDQRRGSAPAPMFNGFAQTKYTEGIDGDVLRF